MLASLVLDEAKYWLMTVMRRHAARSARFSGIVVPVDDLLGHRVMATGAFERTQFEAVDLMLDDPGFVDAEIDQEALFVDVGANIGLYCIAFAHRFPAVLAVEANPQTYAILKANLGLRGLDNVTPLCEGASDDYRDAKIYVPRNGAIGWATLEQKHHKIPVNEVDITCRPLDSMISEHGQGRRVSLLKIDVEGHELSVLRGAQLTLQRDRPVVLFEVLNAEEGRACGDLLKRAGYDRFWTFRRWPEGGKLARLARGARTKLNVRAVPLAVDEFHRAPLICAAAPREY